MSVLTLTHYECDAINCKKLQVFIYLLLKKLFSKKLYPANNYLT